MQTQTSASKENKGIESFKKGKERLEDEVQAPPSKQHTKKPASGPNMHRYVTKMLGEHHAREYVQSVKNFIDDESLSEMFDTLELSAQDHFDPDDPHDTKRRRVEERAGRVGHVSEWTNQDWVQWFHNQNLSVFVGKDEKVTFLGDVSLPNAFASGSLSKVREKLQDYLGKQSGEDVSRMREKQDVLISRLQDVFNPKVNHRTALDDYRIRLKKYFGNGRMVERRTFDHFHKSFPLSPVPPHLFQEEDVNAKKSKESEDYYEPGLFLPHPMKWLPDWGHRKQIASVYGPQYLNYASLPLPKLPSPEEIHQKRLERQRERAYRKQADRLRARLKTRADNLAKQKINVAVHELAKFQGQTVSMEVSKLSAIAASSSQDEYSKNKVTFVGPRRMQVWDPDTFRKMRGAGDPTLPDEFKEMVFENYLTTIDKNNSLPAWKKIYAMHLIPRAFGGPEGDYLDELDEEPELLTKVDDTLFESSATVKEEKDDDGVDELGL